MDKIITKYRALFTGLISVLWINSLSAQEIPVQLQEQVDQFKNKKLALDSKTKKIDFIIHDVLNKIKTAGIANKNVTQKELEKFISPSSLEIDPNARLHVTLRTTEITSLLLAQLAAFKFEVQSSTEHLNITSNHHLITGWVPVENIEQIAQLEQIFHIRPADKPVAQAGDITTEGDAILQANLARNSFGVNGAGQKVGILSNGCTHITNSQSSGDLPASVQIINNRFSGDEGTAMLEIVYDLAPGAALAFADQGNSQADFANNIKLLQQAGCTIICDDILYPLEPVYEDGIIAQTVDDMVNHHNVVYITSAGDQQLDHYEGDFSDHDTDGWHNFTPNDETITTQLSTNATITVVLQWNNQFGKAGDDYDLYIYNEKLTSILASSQNTQDGNDDPVESVSYKNTNPSTITIHLALQKFSGAGRNLSVFTFGDGVTPQEYTGSNGSIYGHAGAKKSLAVGAIDAKDSGHDTIESFSNHGPARIYSYDNSGNPTSFIDRNKPDHCAIDGVQTKTGQLGLFNNPFYGTSAAAAHTAGIAALLRQAAPGWNAAQIAETLNNKAIDIGVSGFDYISGYGRVDAYESVRYVTQGMPNIAVTPNTFAINLIRGNTKTEIMTLGNTGGSNLNFSLSWQPSWSVKCANYASGVSKMALLNRSNQVISDNLDTHLLPENVLPNKSKTNTLCSRQQLTRFSKITDQNIVLFEDFEDGITPPTGWTTIDGPGSPGGTFPAHWKIDQGYVFSGNYSAICYWGYNLNEWLISPALDFSTINSPALSFWWLSSYYWQVYPNDNGDLFVKVSTDGGTTWDSLWTFGDIGSWEDFTWYYTILDLSAYQGYSDVMIAFHVMANNNADVAIDEVMVLGEEVKLDWVKLNPASGTIIPGSKQDIQVLISTIINGDTLQAGDYIGNIIISSNDPNDQTVKIPVSLRVAELFHIKGRLGYYSDRSVPVGDTKVKLGGDASQNFISNSSGRYEFLNLNYGNYTVTPEKNNELKDAITPYDAALILRYNIGALPLTPYQKIAADVSGDKKVNNADAIQILKYYVGLITSLPIGSKWTFVPHDYAIDDANWSNAPRLRAYSPLKSDQLNQDFVGILYGDVSGNWAASAEIQSAGTVSIKLDEFQQTNEGQLLVTLKLECTDPVYSGSFRLIARDPELKLISCSIDSPASERGILVSSNSAKGINVAFVLAQPLSNQPLPINLRLESLSSGNLNNFDYELSEVIVDDKSTIATIVQNISNHKLPTDWQLSQNYPNPFNNMTSVRFAVPRSSKVKIEIFNLMGGHLQTLVNEVKPPGVYQVNWNSRDAKGQPVGSGIYICKMQAGNFEVTKKMALVQ